ncbi:MAG: hypothetical protein KGJ37_06025, partial [Verrucomicrobiota bacterium]|nr:hypothetical protein [Verrucomicrobiota bacterium]
MPAPLDLSVRRTALNFKWAIFAAGGLLALAVFAAYSKTFHVPFVLDDRACILSNPTLNSITASLFPPQGSGMTVSGRPILNLSLAVNYTLWGGDVRAYHATNLAFHILAALTLFGLVRRTLLQP